MTKNFNVFGKRMVVVRHYDEWQLFSISEVGMRSRIYDVVIPSDLCESKLVQYLDDIYHEMATPRHPKVVEFRV
ncbi:hypothetical protein HGP28_16145 [Vibrio sp. SM6]|uniref:DUF7661 domain-containing protein n=1 Tax=Vibrio agarilyticus TaxID=2726741 RepID=A0A7X8TT63_9VIBR|nr:hypothetical protein [Vibrio agarilyticus]NLS14412.1 hypothetical protein [Vibrio agarilyticus]